MLEDQNGTSRATQQTGSLAGKSLRTLVAALAQGGVRFFCNVIIGRFGGPAALGPFASALALVQLAALCWPTPGASAASKFVSRARGQGSQVLEASIQRHLVKRLAVATAILLVGSSAVWIVALDNKLTGLVPLVTLQLAYFAYTYTRGVQFGLDRVLTATRSDMCSAVVALLGVVVLLWVGIEDLWLLSPFAAGYAIAALLNWRRRGPSSGTSLPRATRTEIDRFILLATLGMAASSGFVQMGLIMAGLMGGPSGAGQYSAALALTTPFSVLVSAVSNVLFPAMSAAHGSGDSLSLRRQLDLPTRCLAWGLGLGLGFLVICRKPIIFSIWGASFNEATAIAPLLLIAAWIGAMAVPSVNAITSGSQRGMIISAVSSALGAVIGGSTWLLLWGSDSLLAVAVGYASGSVVIAIIPFVLAWRRHAMRWATLALRIALGTGLLAGYVLVERERPMGGWMSLGAAIAWVIIWSAAFPGERRLALAVVKRRLSGDR